MTTRNIIKTLATLALTIMVHPKVSAQSVTRVTLHCNGGYCFADSVSSIIGTDNYAIGRNSFAGGLNSYASGAQSFVFGTTDTVTGANAVAFGWKNQASGLYSFAQGYQNRAMMNGSVAMGIMNQTYGWAGVALGYSNESHGTATVSLGSYTYTTRDYGITIGSGINPDYPLRNSDYSILMGVNAMLPTLTITESPNDGKDYFDKTGRVAIGATNPQSKLHIFSDLDENAGIILETNDKTNDSAFVWFQDANRYISVGTDNKMRINAGSNNLHLLANHCCLNSETTYFTNDEDRDFRIVSPQKMGLHSGNITLTGKVGVNIENTTASYALAVDGGLITTKVYIQDVDDWPDYVFDDTYRLMPLHELRNYIGANRHLPEMPSEDEVAREGYDLNGMQQALVKKIEELTLYTLKQQEEIEALRKMVEELKGK